MESPPRPQSGLFFTPLDKQQTKSHEPSTPRRDRRPQTAADKEFDKRAGREAIRRPPAEPCEIAFRHRGWLATRARVRDALAGVGTTAARMERFDNCGSDCVIEVNAAGSRHRLRANYCGDRFCVPCSNARAIAIKQNLTTWMRGKRCVFLTLTLKPMDLPLSGITSHLLESFAKLRRHKLLRKKLRAGAYCVQLTRGRKGDHWHVHLHCLAVSDFIPRDALSAAWSTASGGSFIVDIRRVNDDEKAASYVARYATRGCGADVVHDRDHLMECIVGLRGRRLVGTFGEWRKNRMERHARSDEGWRRVGRMVDVYNAARRREAWADGVFRSLWAEVSVEHDHAEFRSIDRPESGDG